MKLDGELCEKESGCNDLKLYISQYHSRLWIPCKITDLISSKQRQEKIEWEEGKLVCSKQIERQKENDLGNIIPNTTNGPFRLGPSFKKANVKDIFETL